MSLKLKWDNLRKGDKFFLGFGILLMILNVLGILMILNGKIETELDFTSFIVRQIVIMLFFVGLPWMIYNWISKRKTKQVSTK